MTNRPVACGPVANFDGELSGWSTTSKSTFKHPSQSAQDPTIALPRNARRQRQAAHLHAAGSRPVFEALLSVSAGNDLDQVLADFARVPINVYHALGADTLPIDQPLAVVDGGRDDG